MKRIYHFCLSVSCLLIAFLLCMNGFRRKEEDAALAARIAPEILRFHVLANSNSPEDQALKLEVRDLLLGALREGTEAAQTPLDKAALCQYILEHRDSLERTASGYVKECGFNYPVSITMETCEFPERTYGDMTLPAGVYEAVRVRIGRGEGQNYWCVLYPSLCYLDSIRAVMPEESKGLLRTLIPEEDFEALLAAGPQAGKRIRFRFRLTELFSGT